MHYIFLLLFLLIPCVSLAEDLQSLTIDAAKELALKNNPDIKALQMSKDASIEDLKIAKSGVLPRIDLSETFNSTNSPAMVFTHKLNQQQFTQKDFDINSLNNPDSRTNWNTKISITQPVFNSGREFININIAKEQQKIQENSLKLGSNQILYSVESFFFLAILTKDAINVLETAKKASQLSETLSIKKNEKGIALKSDVLTAQVNLAQIEKELIKAKNDHNIALSYLNFIMGVEHDKTYAIKYNDTPEKLLCKSLDECMEIAMKNRPEISIKTSFKEIAHQKKRESRFDYFPDLNILGSYNLQSRDPIDSDGNSWDLMITSSFNLFSGGATRAKIKSASANEQKKEYELKSQIEKIRLETKEALYDIDTAKKHIEVMEKTILQTEETHRILRERYNNGLSLMVELISAETSMKDANLNYIKALYDYRLSLLKLRLMTGSI